jgi:hypothetical protein
MDYPYGSQLDQLYCSKAFFLFYRNDKYMKFNALASIFFLAASIPAFSQQQPTYSCPQEISCTQIAPANAVCLYPYGWVSSIDPKWSNNAGNNTYKLASTGDLAIINIDIANDLTDVTHVMCNYLPSTKDVSIQIESNSLIYSNPQPSGDGWVKGESYWTCDHSQFSCLFTLEKV